MGADTNTDLLERIEEIIDANGSVTQPTKDRLILMGMAEVLRRVQAIEADQAKTAKLEKECEELKKNSILMWVKANPKLAGFLLIAILVTWNSIKLLLAEYLGLPVGLLP